MIKIENPPTIKKPSWLKVKLNTGDNYKDMKYLMKENSLNTVCEEARCPNIYELTHWSFADTTGSLVDMLGIRSEEGVSLRATFIIDPHNVIQHVSINNLDVGRNPKDTLRILDALQTDELCACNRPLGGDTL